MIDNAMLASIFGLGVGAIFGWLATSLRTQKRVTELSTTLEIERTKNDGLVQTFEALSDKALRQNNQEFFRLASAKLEPLEKSLEQFDRKLQEVEKQRVGAYAGATYVHGGQIRKGTSTPYVAHLLAVAATVLEYGGDELLHDWRAMMCTFRRGEVT
jgi:hypothetical protein